MRVSPVFKKTLPVGHLGHGWFSNLPKMENLFLSYEAMYRGPLMKTVSLEQKNV